MDFVIGHDVDVEVALSVETVLARLDGRLGAALHPDAGAGLHQVQLRHLTGGLSGGGGQLDLGFGASGARERLLDETVEQGRRGGVDAGGRPPGGGR